MDTFYEKHLLSYKLNVGRLDNNSWLHICYQMSFIGDEVVGCFVLETSKGVVLFDCMNSEQRCIDLIEQGFKDLELNISDLYAIVISHGHGDHFGRADYFQEKYGTKIFMSKEDYLFAKKSA